MFGKDKNKKYELDQEINSGGEGIVYSIVGYPNLVAKVYRAERLSDSSLMKSIEEKILAMLDMNFDPRIDGDLIVAWPTDALYDSSGYFLGYAMPIINNMKSLIWAMRPSDRNILWPKGYRWHNSVAIAFNLSVVIEKLHAAGIVVGDMNTNNILIDPTGNVTMIDAGSFNIRTKEGKLCKCIVGFPEVLPPELQGKDLTKPNNQFSEKTDCFALAIHIFTLLNNNCHPFGCLNYNTEHTSSSSPKIMDNIVNGYCPYVNGETKSTVVDSLGMAMFSDDINALFKRAFHYDAITAVKQSTIDNRPTAKEWREALAKFYSAGFITCTKNPIHEYSKKYNGGCPWCAIEFKKSSNANAGTGTAPGARTTGTIPNAGTGTAPGTRTTGTVPKTGTGTATGTLPVKHKTIPIKYCDLDGNTLHTSQIDVEYGKTAYAYAIDINGYHLFGNNARSEISVNANGYTSQKEIRFVYEKDRAKEKSKHKFFRFLFVAAILYCLILYGMINSAVTNKKYEKALEYMGAFPFYKTLFLDEYNNVKKEVSRVDYDRAVKYYHSGDYSKAYNLFKNISSSYQSTALYTTFCKAHIYTASDYFSTIYSNIFFEDAKDLLAMNSDMFASYMKGTWHYYENGSHTVTMDSDHTVHGMPPNLGSNYYWSVKNGKWRYNQKGESNDEDYYTIEICTQTMFILHSIFSNNEYTLFKN